MPFYFFFGLLGLVIGGLLAWFFLADHPFEIARDAGRSGRSRWRPRCWPRQMAADGIDDRRGHDRPACSICTAPTSTAGSERPRPRPRPARGIEADASANGGSEKAGDEAAPIAPVSGPPPGEPPVVASGHGSSVQGHGPEREPLEGDVQQTHAAHRCRDLLGAPGSPRESAADRRTRRAGGRAAPSTGAVTRKTADVDPAHEPRAAAPTAPGRPPVPPLRTVRAISRKPSSKLARLRSPKAIVAASNEPSATGSARALPTTNSTPGRSAAGAPRLLEHRRREIDSHDAALGPDRAGQRRRQLAGAAGHVQGGAAGCDRLAARTAARRQPPSRPAVMTVFIRS